MHFFPVTQFLVTFTFSTDMFPSLLNYAGFHFWPSQFYILDTESQKGWGSQGS